jgi:hypothetical protein
MEPVKRKEYRRMRVGYKEQERERDYYFLFNTVVFVKKLGSERIGFYHGVCGSFACFDCFVYLLLEFGMRRKEWDYWRWVGLWGLEMGLWLRDWGLRDWKEREINGAVCSQSQTITGFLFLSTYWFSEFL